MTFLAGHGENLPRTWVIHMANRRPAHNTPIHMDFLYGFLQKGPKSMWIGVLWAGLRVAMWITHVGGKFRHGLLENSLKLLKPGRLVYSWHGRGVKNQRGLARVLFLLFFLMNPSIGTVASTRRSTPLRLPDFPPRLGSSLPSVPKLLHIQHIIFGPFILGTVS